MSLENELGTRFFQRSTRRLIPTEAAEVFYERVRDVVAEIDRAQMMVREVGATPRGCLRVSASTTLGQVCVVPLLPDLMVTYPELAVELVFSEEHGDLIADRVDVALRLGSLPDSAYVSVRLCSTQYVLCASPSYLARNAELSCPSQIQAHQCLTTRGRGTAGPWLFRAPSGDVREISASGRCVVPDDLAAQTCALAGMGIALLPRWLAWRALDEGRLVELLVEHDVTPNTFETSTWLLYPSRSHLPLKTRVFVEFVKRRFRERARPWDERLLG
jgi:DNA-binding transcriptional LysR family regulator